ncbi:hypothetical protein ACWEQV_25580 [Rhodococcus aetherivorans]|uniref:hypothetical protein n=1 Tax=Rhodococcus TaxID=1827 RepID=UPI0026EFEDDB|nr:hypothetical protein [Rhodococcus aetherivorans]WKX02031.1 hypothetical protein Q3O43_29595 [Rhodococcus aetherivorans]
MNPSRAEFGRWVVQSGRILAVIPYAHVSAQSVIEQMYFGPGARRRAERWVTSELAPRCTKRV